MAQVRGNLLARQKFGFSPIIRGAAGSAKWMPCYNLAWVHSRERNYPAALASIAEAVALDKTGEFRDRLLHKQQEVMAHLAQRNQQEYLLLEWHC